MESVIDKAIGWFKAISEATKELTSGNVAHKSCAIRGMANRSVEYLGKHKRSLSVIKWQTGQPTEEEEYLVQLKYYNRLIINRWEKFSNGWNWTVFSKSEIIAWCKLSDIEPYKEEE